MKKDKVGVEPTTSGSAVQCSATELFVRYQLNKSLTLNLLSVQLSLKITSN